MEIQDRILKVIEHSKLSRSKFGKKIGVQPQTLHHIVSGRRTNPSFDIIEKIIRAFPEINPRWLITEEGYFLTSTISYENEIDLSDEQLKIEDDRIKAIRNKELLYSRLVKASNYDVMRNGYKDIMDNIDMVSTQIRYYEAFSQLGWDNNNYWGECVFSKYLGKQISKDEMLKLFTDRMEIMSKLYQIINLYKDIIKELYDKITEFNHEHDKYDFL